MYSIICSTLTLFFLTMFAASTLNAGYKIDPWGSKTWTGPGRPPHWSAPPAPQPAKSTKQFRSGSFGKPVGRDRRIRNVHRPGGEGVFWKDKHNHRSRVSGTIYYQEPRMKEVIIEREKHIPVYIQVQRKPAKLQCGGKTITRKDPETGDMIIEYVTGARDC